MTCYDKSLPSPDGRCSRLWCINWLQLVALRIIHENTYVHTLVHFVFFFMQKRRPRLRGWPWGHNSLLDSTRYGLNTGNVVPRVRPVRAIIYLWSHFTTFFFYVHTHKIAEVAWASHAQSVCNLLCMVDMCDNCVVWCIQVCYLNRSKSQCICAELNDTWFFHHPVFNYHQYPQTRRMEDLVHFYYRMFLLNEIYYTSWWMFPTEDASVMNC